ncbi:MULTISPECIES: helix-turn-helix domain-containing protein [Clostridia]|jgi:transcriptional regulator with XRE-family HTH domain|uniref:helix-turn-helix domain-containing protein n=1 Tax=Clostridia TaxID=186801 RepID=UPI00074064BC|nr:helix-turn-helix transcriptional regulator [Clostridium sp. C105KSO13]CUX27934.1 helix-turn-helix protein [Clostridium sp. C105KSO13]
MNFSNFSERIIQIKNDRNLLQKDIANAIELSIRNYQRYEKGEQQPTLPVLLKLADYFDVSLDYFLGRSDDPTRY